MARDAVLARMERHQDRLESGKAIDNPLRMSLAAGFVAADMPTRARSLYRAVLQSDPDHEMAAKLAALIDAGAARARNQIDMAQALNAEGEATAAAALLRRVVERNPKSIAAHLSLIDIALSRDQIEGAMKRCDRVLGFAPDNKPVRNRRSIALKRLEATRGEGRTAAPNAHAGAMQRAQALLAAGDAFQADRIFASVLAETPSHRGALLGRIRAALADDDTGAILDACDRALAHMPQDPEVLTHRSAALARAGRLPEAVTAARAVVETFAQEARPRAILARALLADQQPEAAEEMFEHALRLEPKSLEAHLGLVDTALARGAFDLAVKRCTDALHDKPGHVGILRKQARALQLGGRLSDSVEVLEHLVDIAPTDTAIAMRLAETHHKLGDRDRADALFVSVLQIDPGHHKALIGRTILAEEADDPGAALNLIEHEVHQTLTAVAQDEGSGPETIPEETAGAGLVLRFIELCFLTRDMDRLRAVLDLLPDSLDRFPAPDLMLLAQLAEKGGEFDLAASALLALSRRPRISLPVANYMLRLAHFAGDNAATGRLSEALAKRIDPARRSEFEVAVAALCHGPEEAIRVARSRRGGPRSAEEAKQLGQSLIDGGQARLAARYLRRALRAYPDLFALRRRFVTACVRSGAVAEAERYLDTVESPYPTANEVLPRVDLLALTGRIEEAQALIRDYGQTFGAKVPVQLRIQICLALGQLEEARALKAEFADARGRGGKTPAHFSVTQVGALINELALFRHAEASAGDAETDQIERAHCASYTYPATRVLGNWLSRNSDTAPGPGTIPRRIVQYWNQTAIPAEVAWVMGSWQRQPGYHYTCLDRRRAIQYLGENFDRKIVSAFRLANHPAEEADFLRLAVLWKEGGIYADADDMLVGDLDDLLAEGGGAILFHEQFGTIANNLICARPKHPLIGAALGMACTSLSARANESTWSKTGPGMMTRATAVYVSNAPAEEVRGDLRILQQSLMFRHVHSHIKLAYKSTPSYWNAYDGAVPAPIRDVLSQIVA